MTLVQSVEQSGFCTSLMTITHYSCAQTAPLSFITFFIVSGRDKVWASSFFSRARAEAAQPTRIAAHGLDDSDVWLAVHLQVARQLADGGDVPAELPKPGGRCLRGRCRWFLGMPITETSAVTLGKSKPKLVDGVHGIVAANVENAVDSKEVERQCPGR